VNVIDRKQSQVFFVDGPSETRKTFIYRALMATLRNRGKFVLVTASSDIAASLQHYYWVVELHTPNLIYLLMYNQIPSAI